VATVALTVTPVNDPPEAGDDAAVTDEDAAVPIDVLGNDTDADGDVLTPTVVAGPQHGTAEVLADGTIRYVPAANYHGPDSFTYKVSDGTADSNVATVSVTVRPVNDAPMATVELDAPAPRTNDTLTATATAADVEGDPVTLTYVWKVDGVVVKTTANTTSLTDTLDLSSAGHGDRGQAVTVEVTPTDGQADGETVSAAAQVANSAPTAGADSYLANSGVPLTVPAPGPLTNDTDPDLADGLFVSAHGQPAHGTVAVNPDGSFTYTSTAGYSGVDAFEYTLSDGDLTATGTVSILVNTPPTVEIFGLPATSAEAQPLAADSSVTDPDPGSGFTYAWEVRKDGQPFAAGSGPGIAFTPDDDGTYTVSLTVTDGFGGVGTDTETVAVTNLAPTGRVTRSAVAGPTGIDVTVGWAGVTDPSATDTAAGFRYSFARSAAELATSYAAAGPAADATFAFDLVPGQYPLFLRVFDKDDGYADAQVTVHVGTAGNDVLAGADGIDLLFGLGGNDSLAAGAEADWLDGGSGDDSLDGSDGNDDLLGADGNDRLAAGAGDDAADGGLGDDALFAGTGRDQLAGGDGNDVLTAAAGNATLSGGTGNDVLYGGTGFSRLDGGDGNDLLVATQGDATLAGGRGNDVLWSGAGNDSLDGGDEDDWLFGTTGRDTMSGGAGNDVINAGSGDDVVFGGDGNDRLDGAAGNDLVDGGAGNDTLVAGAGADSLAGGDGDDVFRGWADAFLDDSFSGGAGADRILNPGQDGGLVLARFTPGLSVEEIGGVNGAADQHVTGTPGADVLDFSQTRLTQVGYVDAGAGDDRVVGSGLTAGLTYRGGDGNDTVQAGSVADRLHGGLGADVFRFVSLNVTGEDQVQDWEAGLDKLDVSGLGARAADVSWARSGNDTLITVTVPPEFGGGILRIRLARYTGPLSLDDFVFAL
jgi:Ca2+-binding RTX toxin-like protein